MEQCLKQQVLSKMSRQRNRLPVIIKIRIPLPYHKACFGFISKTLTTAAEVTRFLRVAERKEYACGGYAKVEKNTKLDYKAGFTLVHLYYSVYNSNNLKIWPVA